MVASVTRTLSLLNFLLNQILLVTVFPKYLNRVTFLKALSTVFVR
jgi:hypothetical protein